MVLQVHESQSVSAREALERLRSNPSGLTEEEAASRLAQLGPNELAPPRRVSPLKVLAGQFKNVLIVVLLVAIALSVVLGHDVEAIAIGIILAFSVALGFVQEFRAERSLEALRQMAAPTATVFRGGEERKIAAREVVPGDVLVLHAGDKVSADARVLQAANLHVDEAALTGESSAVSKNEEPLAPGPLPIGDRKNMVHSGTVVTYGRGRAVVVATGASTEFGKIAQMLETVETGRTPLQANLDRVGRILAELAAVVVVAIVALGLFRGQPLIEMLIFGIALAVAVVPEALPAVVTISLALGVQRLVKRNALVRRLAAAETLGSTSFICSDKTGTLTRDEMTVRAVYADGRTYSVTGSGYEPKGEFLLEGKAVNPSGLLLEVLSAGALASDAHVHRLDTHWEVQGDPTEGALVVAAEKAGVPKTDLDAGFPRESEIPFTSESKRMTTLHRMGRELVAYAKGAPEVLIPDCCAVAEERGAHRMDEAERSRLLGVAQSMADHALRVMAIARRTDATDENCSTDLTFLGLVGMLDPPRSEAKAALERCRQAGIKVAMITGDHPATARAVASELGLLVTNRVITGAELERLDEGQLQRDVPEIEVYARVSPADKLRIVSALQKNDYVVAMTGDGVNDAPALKKADIGIAMGITGTDVTKEAAAMTLTDDNFASIVGAVEEGRGIYGNIKKYLMYLLSSNIGEIGLMAGAALIGLAAPLSAVQILYVNLATDGLPALALAVDPPEDDLMSRPPRGKHTGIFTRPVMALMLAGGIWSALVNLGLFMWALRMGHSREQAMMMTFLSLVLIQFVKAYNFRSDRNSIWQRPFANRWLNLAVLGELALLVAIVYVPALHRALGTSAILLHEWAMVAGAALSVLPVLELMKYLVRRGAFGPTE